MVAEPRDVRLVHEVEVAHVAQETPALSCSAIDYVLDGDRELRQLQQQLQVAEQSHDEKGLIENVVQIITESLDDLRNLSRSLSAEFIAGNGFIRTLENEIEQLNRIGL